MGHRILSTATPTYQVMALPFPLGPWPTVPQRVQLGQIAQAYRTLTIRIVLCLGIPRIVLQLQQRLVLETVLHRFVFTRFPSRWQVGRLQVTLLLILWHPYRPIRYLSAQQV